MPEDSVVFTSVIQRMKNSRKNARNKTGSSDASCNALQDQGRKVQGNMSHSLILPGQKHACIVEADESTRKRLEGTLLKDHEDHTAGKGVNSLNHYNLVHKFMPLLKAMKTPDAKAVVEKEWKNQKKYRHDSGRKSETKMR